jgi:alanyl-tRNA synthetase
VEIRRNDGVVVATVEALKGGELRDLSDQLRQREQALAVLIGSSADERAFLVVNLDKSLPERGVDAAAVVREVAPIIGGGGGGRPTLAEAGGKDPEKLGDALERAERLILTALA